MSSLCFEQLGSLDIAVVFFGLLPNIVTHHTNQYMYNRIALVVALFQEAGDALGTMPLLLFYPILTFLQAVVVIAYFGYVLIYLWSAGEAVVNNGTQHVTFEAKDELIGWYWYHFFGFFWTFELVLAFQEAVVAGAVADWYFTRDKKKLKMPIARSFARTLRFSLGSVIAGAFIIAVVQIIRMALRVFEKKVKKLNPGTAVKFCIKCVQCCLWCFEKCLKFLNRNAYIEVAINGKSFCTSAMAAFKILLHNALRVAAINSIGDFVLHVAKCVVILGCTIGAFFWFRNFDEGLTYESVCILLVAVFAYGVASMFIGVYEMTIDTIFIAFCEDAARNDGTEDKRFFMSNRLLKFMSSEEKRTQKRTARKAKAARDDADRLQAQDEEAHKLDIDKNGKPTTVKVMSSSGGGGGYGGSDNTAGYSDV